MVKMVNLNLIRTIFKIPNFLLLKLLKFVEIVETSLNFDHSTMTITFNDKMVLWSTSW